MSQQIGFAAEKDAQDFLIKQGLKSITCNYRSRMGEIDLIMQEGSVLVFIEVRTRASNAYGGALASVTSKKQQKIIKTALVYLMQNKLNYSHPIRFDVICMEGKPAKINWIKNAFGADF